MQVGDLHSSHSPIQFPSLISKLEVDNLLWLCLLLCPHSKRVIQNFFYSFPSSLHPSGSAPTPWTCWPHWPENQVSDFPSPSCPLIPVLQFYAQPCSRSPAVSCLPFLSQFPVESIDPVERPAFVLPTDSCSPTLLPYSYSCLLAPNT